MIDKPSAPIPDQAATASDTQTTASNVAGQTYSVNLWLVTIDTLWQIAKIMGGTALFLGFGLSAISKEEPGKSFISFAGIYIILVVMIGASLFCIWLFWDHISWARNFRIISEENGLTLHENKKVTKVRWSEVAGFRDYQVVGVHGEIIKLPPNLINRSKLEKTIDQMAAQSITEHLVARYKQVGKIGLGPIEITNKGLLFNNQFAAWDSINAIAIDEENNVRIIIGPNFEPRKVAQVSKIPNYYALGAFVELLRPRSSGTPLMGDARNEQYFAAQVSTTYKAKADDPQGMVSINGAKYVTVIYSRGDDRSVNIEHSTIEDSEVLLGDGSMARVTPQQAAGRNTMSTKKPRTRRSTKDTASSNRSVAITNSEVSAGPIVTGDNVTIGNVTATLAAARNASQEDARKLEDLLLQLKAQLADAKKLEPKKAEAIETLTDTLLQQAKTEEPNIGLIEITAEGLLKAAQNIAAVTPTVVGIATQIITLIKTFVGL